MRRIAIFQSDMRVGGIQRSLRNLLYLIATDDSFKEYDFSVFIADDRDIFYSLPESERIHYFYPGKLPYYNRFLPFGIVKALYGGKYTAAEKYDVAIDFNSYWNECALGAICANADLCVCWIHNDVKIKMKEEWKYRLLHFFFKKKYSYYDMMIPVSEGIKEPFYEENKMAPKKYLVINNLIDTREIQDKLDLYTQNNIEMSAVSDRLELVAVGRLCHQKGYDLLLKELALVKRDFHLSIVGEGPLEEEVRQLIKETGLLEKVTLVGKQENPFSFMAKADAFIMHSRYEGQPLAFWEAKAMKLPVIIPKYLEKYTGGIEGCSDIKQAVEQLDKRVISEKERYIADPLTEYNEKIKNNFLEFIGE